MESGIPLVEIDMKNRMLLLTLFLPTDKEYIKAYSISFNDTGLEECKEAV